MSIDKINIKSDCRELELDLINSVAKFLPGFNDSLLIEDELTLEEVKLIDRLFIG